ncbi:MAG: lanthionine synthetase C family protein [Tannerellaceae bacterium]|nr:lanthionine synthetase C family protein [Tannerellaceae bacterium]
MKERLSLKLKEIAECIYKKIESGSQSELRGIYMGDFGMLLFLYYYSNYSQDEKFLTLTDTFTDQLLENFVEQSSGYTFCDGISGMLYMMEILKENDFLEIDLEDSQEVLDKHLNMSMQKEMAQQNHDFIHGALGVAYYFLKHKKNHAYIETFIDYLYLTAEKEPHTGIFKWKSKLGLYDGIGYNISLSHGMSSIAVFLSRFLSIYPSHTKAKEILTGCVNYILSQEIDVNTQGSYFPAYSTENIRSAVFKSRLGWCYGDLGVAIALWQAGKVLQKKEWTNKAVTILKHASTRRSRKENLVIDAGICHGSVGIALIFNRMNKEIPQKEFEEATAYWLEQTIELAEFEDGLAGYKSYEGEKWQSDYSLLTGITGIGLTLLSYLKDDPQHWDEILLLS